MAGHVEPPRAHRLRMAEQLADHSDHGRRWLGWRRAGGSCHAGAPDRACHRRARRSRPSVESAPLKHGGRPSATRASSVPRSRRHRRARGRRRRRAEIDTDIDARCRASRHVEGAPTERSTVGAPRSRLVQPPTARRGRARPRRTRTAGGADIETRAERSARAAERRAGVDRDVRAAGAEVRRATDVHRRQVRARAEVDRRTDARTAANVGTQADARIDAHRRRAHDSYQGLAGKHGARAVRRARRSKRRLRGVDDARSHRRTVSRTRRDRDTRSRVAHARVCGGRRARDDGFAGARRVHAPLIHAQTRGSSCRCCRESRFRRHSTGRCRSRPEF